MVSVHPRRHIFLGFGLILVVSLAILYVLPRPDIASERIPERLSDEEFWNIVTEFSEAGGYFRSDNFVSNESAFQRVIPDLKRRVRGEGVYLGVGPDQNFTYIGALEPKAAFIVDIRRQNMLLHLMYKALFELSSSRAEFLSRLFGRPVPDLPKTASTEQIFSAFGKMASDVDLARGNLQTILHHLREKHRFNLSMDDTKSLTFVYNSFVTAGPEIRYSFPNQYAWRRFPSYSELMLETDGTSEDGTNHSYMASEENFQTIKKMQADNRIIPIVGDFAGDKALRSVGRYVREHGATVSTFYTSNVEFYLFQTEDWKKFCETVSDLPIAGDSVFIRSYFNNYGLQFQNPPGWLDSASQSYTLVDNLSSFVGAFAGGHIRTYFDVVRRSKP
jgi:hypothetical protein